MEEIVNGFQTVKALMQQQIEFYKKANEGETIETMITPCLLVLDKFQNVTYNSSFWSDYSDFASDGISTTNILEESVIIEYLQAKIDDIDKIMREKKKNKILSGPISSRIGIRYMEFCILPIFKTEDEVDGVIILGRDATKQVMLKKELEAAQLAHMKNEAFYKQVFNSTQIIFALHKLIFDENEQVIDFEYIDLNPAYERETGYSLKDLSGNTLYSVFPDPSKHSADWLRLFREAEQCGKSITIEHSYCGKDVWYRTSICSPQKGYVVTFSENITEYITRGKILKTKLSQWKMALQISKQFVWRWRIEKNDTSVKSWFDNSLFEVSSECESVIAASSFKDLKTVTEWLALMYESDRWRVKEEMEMVAAQKMDAFEHEFRVNDTEGLLRWMKLEGKKISDSEESVEYIGVCYDFSVTKTKEAQLMKQNEFYEILADSIDDIILLLQWQGCCKANIVFVNDYFYRKLGYEPSKVKEMSLFDVCARGMEEKLHSFFREVNRRGNGVTALELQSKEGVKTWFEIRGYRYINGINSFFSFVCRDMSEKEEQRTIFYHAREREKRDKVFGAVIAGDTAAIKQGRKILQNQGVSLLRNEKLLCVVLEVDAINFVEDQYDKIVSVLAIVEKNKDWVCWKQENTVCIIGAVLIDEEELRGIKQELATSVARVLEEAIPEVQVLIGAASFFECLGELKDRIADCRMAVKIGKKLWPERMIFHFEEVELYKLFFDVKDKRLVTNYVHQALGSLLNYRGNKREEYLKMLEVFLEADSLLETSRKVFIHHKTAEMRKKKIEKILGVSLEDAETKMRLKMAFHLKKLFAC
ncbi:PAS domain S-box protein [uncultured Anaeromusa sp.]|uniref:PAS domain S-box protein n=1 Tax=uncultured Anaeromusa sp. TaxID=673273 RepID=UPI0029C94AC5|nr:PAS domain S-box protein [uncultured Anaeromusa sp.]